MAWTSTTLSRAITSQRIWREKWAGVSGSWQQAWESEIGKDPMLRHVVMVVSFRLGGGKIIRYATQDMAFDFGTDGERVVVQGLLIAEPEIESTYSFGSGSSSQRSFTMEVAALGFNPWQLIQEQSRFMAGYAEVCLVAPGMNWRDRFVVMRGDMSGGVSFGTAGQSVTFSVSDPKASADIGITEYVLDTDRFADAPEEYIGERFPLVLNTNLWPQALIRTTTSAPPDFLLGYGHTLDVYDSGGGAVVYVDGSAETSGSVDYPWSVVYEYDDLGVPVTLVRFTAGLGVWDDSTAVYAPISDSGGERSVIKTIEELVVNWSMLGPTGLDKLAFSRAYGKVQTSSTPMVYINGSGDSDATRALEYIESTICGAFPMISMAWQPGGYGPVVTDRHATPVGKWRVGQWPLFKRETGWEETAKTSLFNWFTVRHSYDALEDAYTGVVVRNPTNNLLCQISEEQAGPQDMDPLELVISPAAAAEWTADWLVDHYALPSYYVEHAASPAVLLKYKLGDNIDVVDLEIYGCSWNTPVRGTLEKIVYRRGQATVGLRLWPLFPDLKGGATSGDLTSLYTGEPTEQQV